MAEDAPNQRVFGKSDETSFAGKVVVIKVGEKDLVNKQAFKFWRRALKRANAEGAKAVVFDLNTPGGLAFDTARLMMNDMQDITMPSYAFVNREASSAGALIAAATDEIYMYPGSTIGSAELVAGGGGEIPDGMKRKLNSFFDATVRSIVRRKGRNPDVIRAMMFEDEFFDFGDVQVEQGKLLNLTETEAISIFEGKPLLAKGLAKNIEEILANEGLEGVEVVEAVPSGMEKFAYTIAGLSGVLILIGIGGAYLEMKTPGFGLGGGISLLAFGVFFFGNYAAGNMAGYGLMALFLLGVILVIVELFLLPGLLVPGIIGGILILVSLFVAMIDELAYEDRQLEGWSSDGIFELIDGPAMNLAIGLFGSAALAMLMMRYLPSIPLFNRLVMSKELESGDSLTEAGGDSPRIGLTGEAMTDLRPAGKGMFDGEVLDVTAANGFISEGARIKVQSEDGLRVMVEEV